MPAASAISGESFAEIVGPRGNNPYQAPADAGSSFVFQMDVAAERTMKCPCIAGRGRRASPSIRQWAGGNRLQAFDGGAWRDEEPEVGLRPEVEFAATEEKLAPLGGMRGDVSCLPALLVIADSAGSDNRSRTVQFLFTVL